MALSSYPGGPSEHDEHWLSGQQAYGSTTRETRSLRSCYVLAQGSHSPGGERL